LPAIERLLTLPASSIRGISILVLAPTRELALQIEDEAQLLLAHHKQFTVGHVIGGTNINSSYNLLLATPPTVLIATPGRLLDLLQSPTPPHLAGKHSVSVAQQFAAMKTIVYDEADRLLDQGFKKDLDAILRFLPDKNRVPRQAMLFSATVSKEIREVSISFVFFLGFWASFPPCRPGLHQRYCCSPTISLLTLDADARAYS
jgi:ATP-dependent RNA helicase MSS116